MTSGRKNRVYMAPPSGWVSVEGPVTTCSGCHRLLKGATPHLCADCLAPITATKHTARKERKRLKRAGGAASQAFAGGIT